MIKKITIHIAFLIGICLSQNDNNDLVDQDTKHYRMWSNPNNVEVTNSYQDVLDDISRNYGYDIERHQGIVTEDNYILEVWRMKKQVDDDSQQPWRPTRGTVLLGHGMQSNGVTWFCNGAQSLAYQLANKGYDVWVFNNRITATSLPNHEFLTEDDVEFWNFGILEMGQYDLPAVMDYITDATGKEKITYVGHSMGTAIMFSSMAEVRKDYYKKRLNSFIALAPVARMNKIHQELREASMFINPIQRYIEDNDLTRLDGDNNVIGDSSLDDKVKENESFLDQIWNWVSESVKDVVSDWISEWILEVSSEKDFRDIPERTYEFKCATPFKVLIHFTQITKNRRYHYYDYLDDDKNMEAYGQREPPKIPVGQIDEIPIFLLMAYRDTLAPIADVIWLYHQLLPHHPGENSWETLMLASIDGGHSTPLQGKSMIYWQTNVADFVERHDS